jgi:hypothetical protein
MGAPFRGLGTLALTPITLTATVTSGSGTATSTEYYTGFVWAVKAVITTVTTPTITLSEVDNMAQTILTQASASNFTKMPRGLTHAAADGSTITGAADPILINNSRLRVTVASGTGNGSVAVTFYLLV